MVQDPITAANTIDKVREIAGSELDTILEEARKITDGSRNIEYGGAKESFKQISTLANYLGVNISPTSVVKVLIAVKLSRETTHHRRDNLVDLCGYARLLSILEGDEDPIAKSTTS